MSRRWAAAARLPHLLLLLTMATAQAAPPTPARMELPEPVREALQRAELPDDALAVLVMPLSGRGPVLRHRDDVPMQPGSTMKLVTSAVALDRLGPNLRGYTELLSAAPQDGERLAGDLVLRGGGDPELGLPQLWALLLELRHRGIRELDGDVLLDRTLWRPARMDAGLPPFDEAPEWPYNVIPDALQLAGNLVTLELTSEPAGASGNGVPAGPVSARLLPALPGVVIDNRLTLGELPCGQWSEPWKTPATTTDADGTVHIVLEGPFPRACTRRPQLQLLDRTVLADRLLRWTWAQLGGTWAGHAREAATPPGARLLARREARPWGELMRPLNKQSDNALTRMLYQALGVAALPQDLQLTTSQLAEREVKRWFAEQRIDARGLVVDNGSGLSRSERISAQQLGQLLKAALTGRHASDLLMSLPTVGVDGSMRNRLKDSPATGWARLKTGTLRNVVALAGLVPDRDGRPWVMVAMINHDAARRVGRPVLDALADWIARSGMTAPRRTSLGHGPHAH